MQQPGLMRVRITHRSIEMTGLPGAHVTFTGFVRLLEFFPVHTDTACGYLVCPIQNHLGNIQADRSIVLFMLLPGWRSGTRRLPGCAWRCATCKTNFDLFRIAVVTLCLRRRSICSEIMLKGSAYLIWRKSALYSHPVIKSGAPS